LTQAALAEAASIHRVTVANIERGHYANQTLATLEKLARALRITIPDLFRPPAKPRRPAKSKRARR
jgi:transcriptional regulator with XRE-family HTH domain